MAESTVTSAPSEKSFEKDSDTKPDKTVTTVINLGCSRILPEPPKKQDCLNGSSSTTISPVAGPSWRSSSTCSATATSSSSSTMSSSSSSVTRKRPQPFIEKVNQLKEMGLNENVAKKALLFTGNNSISLAVNWALDHSNEDVNGSLEKFVPAPAVAGFQNGHSKLNGHSKQNGHSKLNGANRFASCNRKAIPSSTMVGPTKSLCSVNQDYDDDEDTDDMDDVDEEEEEEDDDDEGEEEEEGRVSVCQGFKGGNMQRTTITTSSSDDYDELEEGEIVPGALAAAAASATNRLARPQVLDSSDEDEDGHDEAMSMYKVAIVVNGGMNMSPGRVAKQVAHAMMGLCRIVEISKDPCLVCEFGYWQELGEDIAIVRGNSTVHLRDLRQIAEDLDLLNFLVESPEHTLDKNGNATVLSVFGSEEGLDNIMGRLPSF